MSKRAFFAVAMVVGLAIAAGSTPSIAQSQSELLEEYVKTLRQDLTARRDATMRAVIQLNDDEAKVFWPMKDEYDKELKKIGDARRELLQEWGKVYNQLTDAKAQELASRFFELFSAREQLRKRTFDRMSEEISAVVAAQFLQVQTQFETMADLQLATYVPLAVRQP